MASLPIGSPLPERSPYRSAASRLVRHRATAWGVLVLSLGLTVLAWYGSDQYILRRAQDRFLFQTEEARVALEHRMHEYAMVLKGGAGLFDASDTVERHEWKSYVAALDIQRFYPGIQGLGFSRVIPAAALAPHEASIRAEGFPDYRVRPGGGRPLYTAIVFLEPFDWRNRRAFGYDMYSEPVRREAMERARDSGTSAVSGLVKLVQETDRDVQKGFIMYQPVYRQDLPVATVAERRAALMGFVYAPFRVGDLMAGILGRGAEDMDINLFDGAAPSPENQLFDGHPLADGRFDYPAPGALFERSLHLDMAGRPWTLYFHTEKDFVSRADAAIPPLVLLLSLVANLLLYLFFRSLALQQARAEAMARDITAELRDSEANIRALVEFAPDAIVVIDEKGAIETCNPAAELFFGYRVEEMIGRNVSMLMPSPHREAHDGYIARYLAGGVARVLGVGREVQAQRKDGTLTTIHLRVGEQQRGDGGRRFIGFIRDLSDRIHAEAALQEREALFRRIIETTSDAFWIVNPEGRFVEVNDVFCRLSGYSREELLAMSIGDVDADESPAETAARIRRILEHGSELFETRHRAKDGHLWHMEISVTYAPGAEGRILAFGRDISERRRVAQELAGHRRMLEVQVAARTAELQVSEERARLILESTADGLYGADAEGRFTFVNPAGCRLLGFRQEELLGRSVHEVIHHSRPDGRPYPAEECRQLAELFAGRSLRLEHDVYWRRDGQALHVAVAGQPMRRGGGIVGAVVSFSDIKERLEAEEALLRQSQQLQERAEALERFNRILVGRELTMIRLKGQVNELAARLGEGRPYDLSFADEPLGGSGS